MAWLNLAGHNVRRLFRSSQVGEITTELCSASGDDKFRGKDNPIFVCVASSRGPSPRRYLVEPVFQSPNLLGNHLVVFLRGIQSTHLLPLLQHPRLRCGYLTVEFLDLAPILGCSSARRRVFAAIKYPTGSCTR